MIKVTDTIVQTGEKLVGNIIPGAAGGIITIILSFLLQGKEKVFASLLLLMAIDIITGISSSLISHNPLESRIAMKGLVKVGMYMILAIAAVQVNMVLAPFGLLYPSLNIFNFVVGYISMIELISIVENIKKVGVKVPNVKKFIPRVKKGD